MTKSHCLFSQVITFWSSFHSRNFNLVLQTLGQEELFVLKKCFLGVLLKKVDDKWHIFQPNKWLDRYCMLVFTQHHRGPWPSTKVITPKPSRAVSIVFLPVIQLPRKQCHVRSHGSPFLVTFRDRWTEQTGGSMMRVILGWKPEKPEILIIWDRFWESHGKPESFVLQPSWLHVFFGHVFFYGFSSVLVEFLQEDPNVPPAWEAKPKMPEVKPCPSADGLRRWAAVLNRKHPVVVGWWPLFGWKFSDYNFVGILVLFCCFVWKVVWKARWLKKQALNLKTIPRKKIWPFPNTNQQSSTRGFERCSPYPRKWCSRNAIIISVDLPL